jgi:AbrB family transcriptional regulator (stage V sporulation protein T)
MTDIETAKMSERGQIIIPKDVRDYINAKENTIFTIMPLDKDTIIMKKLDKEQLVKEFRSIRAGVKEKMSQKDIDEEIKQGRR